MEILLGHETGAAAGSSVFDWIHPEDVPRAIESLALLDALGTTPHLPMIVRVRHLDGHYIDFDMLSANHLDDPLIEGIVLNLRLSAARTQYIEPIRAIANGGSSDEVLTSIAGVLARSGYGAPPAFIVSERAQDSGRFHSIHQVHASKELAGAVTELFDGTHDDLWSALGTQRLMSIPATSLPAAFAALLRQEGLAGLRVGGVVSSGRVEAILIAGEMADTWFDGAYPPSLAENWIQLVDVATVAFERNRAQDRLLHAATHDPLTGLANRAHFFGELGRLRAAGPVSILYLDLDEFKQVNDRYGHAAGDQLLVEVARRLSHVVRPGDVVARLGGDEFAMAVQDMGPDLVSNLVDRIGTSVLARLPAGCGVNSISISVGTADDNCGPSADLLVHRADTALLEAKRRRRARGAHHAQNAAAMVAAVDAAIAAAGDIQAVPTPG